MVHLPLGRSNENTVQVATDLAERLKVQKVIGIAGSQPPQTYGDPALLEMDRVELEKGLKDAEESFRNAFGSKVAKLEWRSAITLGLVADYIARELRAADLLITPSEHGGSIFDSRRVLVADLVMRAGRPVFVVGDESQKLNLESIVLGWKESREARRVANDALPLLRMAGRVTVVEIASEDEAAAARKRIAEVADWLKEHKIAASSQVRTGLADDAAELDGLAIELGAGVVVAGAYGHNRLREWVLGGVTRDLLLRPARCSFVSH
jgi:nucleotide-binding universal stress UspA family protein